MENRTCAEKSVVAQNKIAKSVTTKIAIVICICVIVLGSAFENAYGADSSSAIAYINSSAATEMYRVENYRSGDCYLTANMYMLRRRAFLDNMDWSGIKNDMNPAEYNGGIGSLRQIAASDDGWTYNSMKLDFYYSYGSRTYHVRNAAFPDNHSDKLALICKLLDEHPEGIAAHGWAMRGFSHAVLLTHYKKEDNGEITIYAVDSAHNTASNNVEYGGWNSPMAYGVQRLSDTLVGSIDNLSTYKYIATNMYIPRDPETPQASQVWTRLYGAGRYDTMEEIISEGFTHRGGTVVIASGATFKDALPASGLAGLFDAPVVITSGSSLSEQAKLVLENLLPSRIYIAGGPFAVSDGVQTEIEAVTGVEAIRVMGGTSSGTSAELALAGERLWSSDGTAIIATNSSFKDALSVAPIAYAKNYPILLADGGKKLSDEVLSAMDELGISNVIIVGGTGAVSEYVEMQLDQQGITIRERLWGANGVKTSAAIAKWGINHGMTANNMGVATSQSFPDALTGAAFCGHNNSVLVLADDRAMENASFPTLYKASIQRAFVFGGESAVGINTWNALVDSVK